MESKNLQFKTNLNCGNCVAKVQGDLDSANVDTDLKSRFGNF